MHKNEQIHQIFIFKIQKADCFLDADGLQTKKMLILCTSLWGYSSVGRALAWHARGQRFDPAYLHQDKTRT